MFCDLKPLEMSDLRTQAVELNLALQKLSNAESAFHSANLLSGSGEDARRRFIEARQIYRLTRAIFLTNLRLDFNSERRSLEDDEVWRVVSRMNEFEMSRRNTESAGLEET